MALELGRLPKHLARIVALVVVAGGTSACSSAPDWVDPTTWFGSDTETSAQQIDQSADQTTADNSQPPDLADVPNKPAAPSTPDEQKQVAGSLQADRSHNQYSGDALRGGTEAAAPPPPDTPPPEQVADATPPSGATQPATASADQTASASSPDTTGSGPAAASPPAPSASGSAAVPATASTSAAAPTTQVAMADEPAVTPSPSGALPAVPAVGPGAASGAQMSDSDLGFQPSKAPPLDPSVSQFVPQPIIARYQQTASVAAAPGMAPAPYNPEATGPAVPAVQGSAKGMGGPESMSGAVVANFDTLQAASVAPSSVYASPAGLPPTAVVFFPHDTTVLSAEGKTQVHAAVQAFQAAGGQGFIRVVGHSSSRTANMPLERHLIYNFERSQARANAVARALIAEGVPATKVLIEAVGDSQPVYYESMPQGEEGNRRAEIFLQS